MYELTQEIPDAESLLTLEPEELGSKLLLLTRKRFGAKAFNPSNLEFELWNDAHLPNQRGAYPRELRGEICLAISEAWAWLRAQGLIVPDSGTNGQNGWLHLSRRARSFESEADFTKYATARTLPREALHPRIADKVWMAFVRGEFDVAVFQAMKAVEVAVREAANLSTRHIGTKLMREAFHPDNGPLTDMTQEKAEREALSALFAGAIGYCKNPRSHRDVDLTDPTEATELIMMANHLLRIVDEKSRARHGSPG